MKPPAPVTQIVWPWPESDEASTGMLLYLDKCNYMHTSLVTGKVENRQRQRREEACFLLILDLKVDVTRKDMVEWMYL
jgi:hypothetical protein